MLQLCLHKSFPSSDSTAVVTGTGISSDYIESAHANQGFGFFDAFLLEWEWLLLSQTSVLADSGKPWKSTMDKAAIAIYLLDGNRIAAQNWDNEKLPDKSPVSFLLVATAGPLTRVLLDLTHMLSEKPCVHFSVWAVVLQQLGYSALPLLGNGKHPHPKSFAADTVCGHNSWHNLHEDRLYPQNGLVIFNLCTQCHCKTPEFTDCCLFPPILDLFHWMEIFVALFLLLVCWK